MGDGSGDGASDEIKVDQGDANLCARVILAMVNRLNAVEGTGEATEGDMLSLLQNWIKLSIHFQRGSVVNRPRIGAVKDARKHALAIAYSSGGLLADFKGERNTPVILQFRENRSNPPKPGRALLESLNQLMNFVFDDRELARKTAYHEAEGAFASLYYDYRARLAADPSAEQRFRALVASLRNGHMLH